AQNFPYWFAGNFQKYVGKWNDMPVDSHMLIALSAPRPVFITGGTGDQWADPVGEFKAGVAAGARVQIVCKNRSRYERAAASRHTTDQGRYRVALPHGRTRSHAG